MNGHYPIHHGLRNVSLGAMRKEYIPLLMPGVNDLQVTRGVLIRPPVTLEDELAWYDGLAQRKSDVIFAILLHEKDASGVVIGYRYIGQTGLHGIAWPGGHATSGTLICDESCFGKGYGTEAKLLLLYDAFRVRGLRKVCSDVKVFNGNSWGHLLACGYKQTGRRTKHHFYNGGFVDQVSLEIFREEWEPVWRAYQETKSLPKLTTEDRARLQKETSIT
ncbi:MAG: GNAT family protein [Minisyncoccia bacterium]